METKETVILFTGDSITDGNRLKKKSQEWDLNHQIGHSYAYVLNALIGMAYPERNFKFKNRGVSGNRVIDLYSRIETDLLPIKPDILSILVGVNDGPGEKNNYEATKKEKYERVYRQLLDEVKENLPECKIILVEPFVCRCGSILDEFDKWESSVKGYGETVRRLSEDYGAVFVPLQEEFDKMCQVREASYWCWDGVHPTENGHGLIAKQWLKAASPVLNISGIGRKCMTF